MISQSVVSTAERIRELTDDDVQKLTHLFHIKPEQAFNEGWFAEQSKVISKLPSKLLKPKNPFSRLGLRIHIGAQQANLCPAHKALNPRLVRRIFLQVVNEVTVRKERLSQWPCPQKVEAWLKRIDKINSFWMSPDSYRVIYQVQTHEERFEMVEGGCEACILSRIGGNFQVLLDLEVSAWSRRKRGASHDPCLLRFTDAWFYWFKTDEEVRELNRDLGREVRDARRACLDERRRNRAERENNRGKEAVPKARAESAEPAVRSSLERDYAAAKFTSPQVIPIKPVFPVMKDPFEDIFPPRDEDDEDQDKELESAITQFYENRMPKVMGPNQTAPPAAGIHSAFKRQSIASDETLNPYNYKIMKRTNTTAWRDRTANQAAEQGQLGRSSTVKGSFSTLLTPPQRKHSISSAYSASVYSQASNEAPEHYAAGAHDTQSPYVAPLGVTPKTPAQKPIRTERSLPPVAAKAKKVFTQIENQSEAACQYYLENSFEKSDDTSSIWTDDTVHTADPVCTKRAPPQQANRRREFQKSRANRTSENSARVYRDLLAEHENSHQALVGEGGPTPSPPPPRPPPVPSRRNRRGPRPPSPDRMSGSTNWGTFY